MNPRGFSALELLVTLIIVALVCASVLGLLNHTSAQSRSLDLALTRRAALQFGLDLLLEDIISASQEGSEIEVKHHAYGWQETSRITIKRGEQSAETNSQVDWVAAPRQDEEDLVLFRRDIKPGQKEPALYIPICEHLYSFRVALLKADGTIMESGREKPEMIEILAQLYRGQQPDPSYLMSVQRTFCLNRFRQPEDL